MKSSFTSLLTTLTVLAALQSSTAAPIPRHLAKRQVPHEHAWEKYLTSVRASQNLNNAAGLGDPVFALLGDAAAAQGVGQFGSTPECVQQQVADQAFTNAKDAGDVQAMADALVFRALERNTGAVGQASKLCAETAVNPEVAAIQQHQDAAGDGAQATNKAIVLELAKQIASIGGDPLQALESGTFAPGKIGDPTAKGNSCDDANDPIGCIFTQNLQVLDATPEEIEAAVSGSGSGSESGSAATGAENLAVETDSATASEASATCAPAATVTVTAGGAEPTETATATAGNGDAPAPTTTQPAAPSSGDIGDFGSCSVPEIEFGTGFDGRKESSFQPTDKASFNHGSAQNGAIITQFICDQLTNSCKADATAKATCKTAQDAAIATGNNKAGAFADAFNGAFGIQTDFASVQQIDDQGRPVGAAVTAAPANDATPTTTAAADDSSAAAEATAAPAPSGGNVQTFTGALGAPAPEVVPGGKGFQIILADGSVNGEFINLKGALGRSCDVQKNLCANAANSKSVAGLTVAQCETQQQACVAAGSA